MADRLTESLKYQYVYVPRGTEKDTLQLGKMLGLAVARERRARLTVLSVQKSGAIFHSELAKQAIVTERSGSVPDGGVVLAWCPRHKTMEKLQHLEKSVVVLVEWVPGEMEAWAKLKKAYNVVTGEIMGAGLNDEAVEILERIVFEGYKGWTDSISDRLVRSFLDDLAALGAYDRDLVLAYVRQSKYESSVERLVKILDAYDTTTIGGAESPRHWDL
ncbi:MAG: hypothetical protein JWR52_945 [Marmoricola sp.]|nr:hypothetical protein [Marmoricola sp.]